MKGNGITLYRRITLVTQKVTLTVLIAFFGHKTNSSVIQKCLTLSLVQTARLLFNL